MFSHLKAKQYYFKEILAFIFLILAYYFLKQERDEIQKLPHILSNADGAFLILGVVITFIYIFLQALMYVYSFKAVQRVITIGQALRLFLKRNLVSVFLPGGGVTSLMFFNEELVRTGVSRSRIGFASYIYAVVGFVSLAIVAVPVIIYLTIAREGTEHTWAALAVIGGCMLLVFLITHSFVKRGWVFHILYKLSPQIETLYHEIESGQYSLKSIYWTIFWSIGIEVTGILHLYIAMRALGLHASFEACVAGYTIATLFFAVSPFLRGLGAVEVSLIYMLQRYGINGVEAISVTLLYRIFEFWMPLVFGIGAFFFVRGNIFMRFLPSLLFSVLGIVNMLSVLTPPLQDRLHLLREFLPLSVIHFSNIAVMITGALILCCAAFLFRGFKNAWWMAVFLTILSLCGNIAKGVDYEEACLAFFTLLILLATHKNYYIKGDARLQNFGLLTAAVILGSVLIYGVIGFYFLDQKEFGVDFDLKSAIISTLRSFLLLDPVPEPISRFATGFIYSINLLGTMSIVLLVYVFIKPYVFKSQSAQKERQDAYALVQKYGHSADDYFKSYDDKSFFFSTTVSGFVAYKSADGYAVALGEPVCPDDHQTVTVLIKEFEKFCFSNGLKTAYYKIAAERINVFQALGKKALPIGLEAIVDTTAFTLEGKERKSLRNTMNALAKKGFKTCLLQPPIKDGILQKLQFVSDNWLSVTGRHELFFSSGVFNWDELKQQQIITVENEDEMIVAFLNIIPDYVVGELTYDLIRRTEDAPSGVMDALIVALIGEVKKQNLRYLNMGMAAMSGIENPKGFPEWAIKFAYEKLPQFKHYQGLYEFKDKFSPVWTAKYMIYENHYDLASLPMVISKITKR
ncbi:phosphatidylglycerol lysyltransferase domain-containing protein [Sphingobacterium yanglingense]|uniref:Phosphatidylglycerol lysyltransferase n=1 Tax=Sphingobacterium yanglingense TaxID=1437280 RepID=A0A4R6WIS3_9SPHI|nr:phosphatidylglycerol lysyltransferase domain-containing protein [Sphingobacterium yanglingense]TDQ80190.1 phosphatidylglycerol lysyltransferase [Sphingobacterium yanglingense]